MHCIGTKLGSASEANDGTKTTVPRSSGPRGIEFMFWRVPSDDIDLQISLRKKLGEVSLWISLIDVQDRESKGIFRQFSFTHGIANVSKFFMELQYKSDPAEGHDCPCRIKYSSYHGVQFSIKYSSTLLAMIPFQFSIKYS